MVVSLLKQTIFCYNNFHFFSFLIFHHYFNFQLVPNTINQDSVFCEPIEIATVVTFIYLSHHQERTRGGQAPRTASLRLRGEMKVSKVYRTCHSINGGSLEITQVFHFSIITSYKNNTLKSHFCP